MTGFFGWTNMSSNNADAKKIIEKCTKQLSQNGSHLDSNIYNDSALYSCTDDISCIHKDGDDIIVIDGIIRINNSIPCRPQDLNSTLKELHKNNRTNQKLALTSLKGQYSLASHSENNKSLVLATDKIGSQSIYYAKTKQGLVYSSSAESIRRHPDVDDKIDHQAIYDYMYFHVIPSPRTIFKNIKKLEPASYLTFVDDVITIEKYWTPTYNNQSKTYLQLKDELSNITNNSIEFYGSNNSTGTFLSGGIDSSTISGLYNQQYGPGIQSYSMGFSQSGYDEIEYARLAANHFKLHLNEYYVTTDDIAESITDVMSSYDEPFGNSSAIPTYMCAKFAKSSGSNYLLAGDGGDELFAGNSRYAEQKLFNIYQNIPKPIRKHLLEPLFVGSPLPKLSNFTRKIMRYIDISNTPMPDRMEIYNYIIMTGDTNVFSREFLANVNTSEPMDAMRNTYNSSSANSLVDKMLYYDWKYTLADNDLRKVGKMCNLAGVKVFYPLLDDDLLNLSTEVPDNLKLRGKQLRYFFKKSYSDFLPKEIINKSKHGFGLPFGEWLKTSKPLQDIIYEKLNQLEKRNIFAPEFISESINNHKHGHAAYYGTLVWLMAMLETWLQEHNMDL